MTLGKKKSITFKKNFKNQSFNEKEGVITNNLTRTKQ